MISEGDLETSIEILECCLASQVRRSSRAITLFFDKTLAPTGITTTQLTLLATVAARKTCSVTEISDTLGMNRASLSRTIDPLIHYGMIENKASSQNRTKKLVITEFGLSTMRMAEPYWRHAQERVIEIIGNSNITNLIAQHSLIANLPVPLDD